MLKEVISIQEFRTMNKGSGPIRTSKAQTIPKPSKEKDYISQVLQHCGERVVKEFQFAPDRKFKSDWALPDHKILLEYEGLMSRKSRHTTVTGFTNDSTKYNLATILGFRLLRYTPLNFKNVGPDLRKLLNK